MKIYMLLVIEQGYLTECEVLPSQEEASITARRVIRRMANVVKDHPAYEESHLTGGVLFYGDESAENQVLVLERELALPKPKFDIPFSLSEVLANGGSTMDPPWPAHEPECGHCCNTEGHCLWHCQEAPDFIGADSSASLTDPFEAPKAKVIEATLPLPNLPALKPELLGYDPADPELVGGYDDDDSLILVKDILKDSCYFKRMGELTEDQKTALTAYRIGACTEFQALLPGLGLFDRNAALSELTLGTEAGKKIVELDCQALIKIYAVDRAV